MDGKTSRLIEFSMKEVSTHSSPQSCWIVVCDKVYDVTTFIREHPGGEDIIFEHGGLDATTAFMSKGHSDDAHQLLEEYIIGYLIKADRIDTNNN